MSEPQVLHPGDGEPLWFLDTLMQIKLSGAASGDALAVFEQLAPAGSATPMHRHDATDEHFYVLSGEVIFHGPAGARRCPAGSFVTVPRGTIHAFRVADAGAARLLVLSAPATFERFVRAASRPAAQIEVPPAGGPPDPAAIQQLAALGAQHDVTPRRPATTGYLTYVAPAGRCMHQVSRLDAVVVEAASRCLWRRPPQVN